MDPQKDINNIRSVLTVEEKTVFVHRLTRQVRSETGKMLEIYFKETLNLWKHISKPEYSVWGGLWDRCVGMIGYETGQTVP